MSFSISDLSSMLLSWILVYGAIVLFVAVLLGSIGVPLPTSFLLLAAGAFVRQDVLNLPSALTLALVGAIIGDSLSYGLGRVARGFIVRRFGQLAAWQNAEENLHRRGAVAIFFTRWLVTALAVPTNLVAGSAGYPYARFLFVGAAGEIIWVLAYGVLGYVFSDQWETISSLISNFGGLLLGALLFISGVVVLVYSLRRGRKQQVGKSLAK
jgi:membrane protein DedA with SNARE-associated domain